METKIKLMLVDDNKPFIEGLSHLLEKYEDYNIIGVAYNGNELLNHKSLAFADIILLDIEMPEMNGFEIAKKINWRYPNIKLIAITMYQEMVYLEKLVKVGFKGFVNKTEITDKLIAAINAVRNGKLIFPDYINLNK